MSNLPAVPVAIRKPYRIAIADDHHLVSAGLQSLLADHKDFRLKGSVKSGNQAIELVAAESIDILILDVDMPNQGAFDVMEKLLSLRPGLRVLIYTCHPEQHYAVQLSRLGAWGYLDKTACLDEIVAALRTIASGKHYFSDRTERLMKGSEVEAIPLTKANPAMALSAREFRIFLRLAAGERIPEIAEALGVSEVTVSVHRTKLLEKLKLKTNSHITEFALKNRFLN